MYIENWLVAQSVGLKKEKAFRTCFVRIFYSKSRSYLRYHKVAPQVNPACRHYFLTPLPPSAGIYVSGFAKVHKNWHIFVVFQLYPWFNFYFSLFSVLCSYVITNIKLNYRIKLNYNIYIKVSICTSRFAYIHQDFYIFIKIISIQQSFHRYIKIRGDIYTKLNGFRLIVVKLRLLHLSKYSRRAGFTIEKGTK